MSRGARSEVMRALFELEQKGIITRNMTVSEILDIMERRGYKFDNVDPRVLRNYIAQWKRGYKIPKELRERFAQAKQPQSSDLAPGSEAEGSEVEEVEDEEVPDDVPPAPRSSVSEIKYSPIQTVTVRIRVDPRLIVLYNALKGTGVDVPFDVFINASALAYWKSRGIDLALLQMGERA